LHLTWGENSNVACIDLSLLPMKSSILVRSFLSRAFFVGFAGQKKTLTIEIRACFAVVWGLTSFAFSLGRTKQYLPARKVSQSFMA
jgi:hypothetical protein|tara:strand:- start:113 stop:370 length:258 start_codon:yes stop_codon:yes gene_type:complete